VAHDLEVIIIRLARARAASRFGEAACDR
jgi:hypothetical protein